MSKHDNKSHDEADPYSTLLEDKEVKLKSPEKESARARKFKIIKQKLTESSFYFQNGFLMGAMVGGSFGTIIGKVKLEIFLIFFEFILSPMYMLHKKKT